VGGYNPSSVNYWVAYEIKKKLRKGSGGLGPKKVFQGHSVLTFSENGYTRVQKCRRGEASHKRGRKKVR